MTALLDRTQTVTPSPADQEGARLLAHMLEVAKLAPEADRIRAAFVSVLHDMEKGQGFAIMALDEELSPTQAAKLLGVSRAHFMRAIQQETITYRMVGAHYRVRLQDVLKYREERTRRGKLLDELTAQAEELGMGY